MSEDSSRLAQSLRDWLAARMPGAQDLSVTDLFEPAQGYSSRTILFTARWLEGQSHREKGLVARLQRSVSCPLLADIFHQQRVMATASSVPGVPVPAPLELERDPAVLGAPFFLMERASGQVPPDFPSYHAQGWVADLPLTDRTRMWWNGFAAMERLHRIDWRETGELSADQADIPDAGFYLRQFIRPWFEWAAHGRSFPEIEQAMADMHETVPPVSGASLVWNDARPGNVMFDARQEVTALFDFEVATLGPAEIDIAWWLYADIIFSDGFGVPRLAGIPTVEAARKGIERLYARDMPDLDYYLALAALKHAVISIRDYGNEKREANENDHIAFALRHMRGYLDAHRA